MTKSGHQAQVGNQEGGNFTDNPFSGLSTLEALEEAKRILQNVDNFGFDEFQIRRIQLKNSQPRAYALAEKEGLVDKWKGWERLLE